MRLTWVDPLTLSNWQWSKLLEGGKPGGWTGEEIAAKLLSRQWAAFETDGGMLAVSKAGTRLTVTMLAIDKFGWRMREFRNVMVRLASDLGCDTVETTVFSERLMQAMVRIKAQPESWNVVWQVEGTSRGSEE